MKTILLTLAAVASIALAGCTLYQTDAELMEAEKATDAKACVGHGGVVRVEHTFPMIRHTIRHCADGTTA